MPDYLQELSRKYGKLLAQAKTQYGHSTQQVGVPGQTGVAGGPDPSIFDPLLERLNNSMFGAAAGLVTGGPVGAAAGAVLPQVYGLHPEIDRAMDAMGPGVGAMAVMPPMGRSLTKGTAMKPNPRLSQLHQRLNDLRFAMNPRVAQYEEIRAGLSREPRLPGLIRWLDRAKRVEDKITTELRGTSPTIDVQEGAPTFFSSVREAFKDPKLPEKLSAEQAKAVISKYPGVKQEEVKWLGLDELLKTKPKWTKSELLKHIDDNEIDVHEVTLQRQPNTDDLMVYNEDDLGRRPNGPRYENYTLPGGENYREVLLTWGNKPNKKLSREEALDQLALSEYGRHFQELEPDQALPLTMDLEHSLSNAEQGAFVSGHFNTPNILAHMRLKDRTTPDGKRVLFVEEVQSDWQKALRRQDQANADPTSTWNYRAGQILREKGLDEYAPEVDNGLRGMDIRDARAALKNQTPDAPLARNYHELAMKRIMRMAAEGGYDAVGWTTGKHQAERYSRALAANIDNVEYSIGGHVLRAYKNGDLVQEMVVDVDKLPEYVGPEAAENIIRRIEAPPKPGPEIAKQFESIAAKEAQLDDLYLRADAAEMHNDFAEMAALDGQIAQINHDIADARRVLRAQYVESVAPKPVRLSVSNMTVGDRGYANVYDQQLVQTADKLGKKFGAKTGKGKVRTGRKNGKFVEDGAGGYLMVEGEPNFEDVHYLSVTPAMRQTLPTKGLPLFEAAGAGLGSSFLVDYMRRQAKKQTDQKEQ